ncbi:DUF3592 domain-containing protein [Chitinibacter sp. ZOR0017]|uniref:DUF3592 domain-containing protein n=1 Tax=Chitinibacter sp. ZOR0017 TaxID=1339254 RepID=UPI00064851CA|nr:DUF3592 domain-containing protein [Chitinibacter sp. ZOR0017]
MQIDPSALEQSAQRVGQGWIRWLWCLQLVVGLALLGLSYVLGADRYPLVLRGELVQGQLLRYERLPPDQTQAERYRVYVSFIHDGRRYQFADWNLLRARGGVAEQPAVIYDPTEPTLAMLDRGAWRNALPWLPPALVGVFLLLVGLRSGWKARSAERG